MKTVILSPDIVGPIKNGGIGTFATNLAWLLKQHGHDVSIVFTGPIMNPRREWEHLYADVDIPVIEAHPQPDKRRTVGNNWFIQHSQAALKAIPPDTQIVYAQGWRGNAFQLLRQRRLSGAQWPTVVMVLHSPSAWLRDGMRQFPDEPEEHLALDFVESYARRTQRFRGLAQSIHAGLGLGIWLATTGGGSAARAGLSILPE